MTTSREITLDEVRSVPDMSITAADVEHELANPISVETWREFASKSTDNVPCIIEGLWPEGAIGFVASPPKKGKTWLALSLALSVATGTPYLTTFEVQRPRPVMYLALEGHRSALTHRLAAMARGIGLNPDTEIPNLTLVYKPRGINMADPGWANHIAQAAEANGTELLIVDVLRAAAVMKENSADEFAALISNLAPLLDGVRSIAFLHHFIKLSETTKGRDPGERMSGSGAMYGALDVGMYITGSDDGARTLRVEFEARDIASPDAIGLSLQGDGSGKNGGFTYRDKAWWTITEAPEEDDVQAPAEDIKKWLIENGPATRAQISVAFDISERTVARREVKLLQMGVKSVRNHPRPTTLEVIEEPGHEPGHDNPDSVMVTPLSLLNPNGEAKTEAHLDNPDTEACHGSESGDLQGHQNPDNPDSPTERDLPVSGVSPADPEIDEQDQALIDHYAAIAERETDS